MSSPKLNSRRVGLQPQRDVFHQASPCQLVVHRHRRAWPLNEAEMSYFRYFTWATNVKRKDQQGTGGWHFRLPSRRPSGPETGHAPLLLTATRGLDQSFRGGG